MAAACMRLLPLTCSIPSSSSSSSNSQSTRRRNLRVNCSAKIPMPPLNPNDPFLAKLVSVAANSPEQLLERPINSDTPPYLDIFYGPRNMAVPAGVARSRSKQRRRRPKSPPPDLASLLLDGRIVYIGMPLVSAVTELVIAELLYLHWVDSTAPIYIYINSTGTTRDDDEPVASEAEGFAIYDSMMRFNADIYTVAVGAAIGQACLLLAAGTKGKRFMMPHAKAVIQQPRVPSSGLMPASDVFNRAKVAKTNRDMLVELLAHHTGNSVETIAKVMRHKYYMDCIKAKEFGVIDKIVERGDERLMADLKGPRRRKARIKVG